MWLVERVAVGDKKKRRLAKQSEYLLLFSISSPFGSRYVTPDFSKKHPISKNILVYGQKKGNGTDGSNQDKYRYASLLIDGHSGEATNTQQKF